jgi:hypothetical protein
LPSRFTTGSIGGWLSFWTAGLGLVATGEFAAALHEDTTIAKAVNSMTCFDAFNIRITIPFHVIYFTICEKEKAEWIIWLKIAFTHSAAQSAISFPHLTLAQYDIRNAAIVMVNTYSPDSSIRHICKNG